MKLNNKFDVIIKKIASNSQNEKDIKKELILIFKDIKGFKFANGEKFDKKALVLVMMTTIIECKKNIIAETEKTNKENLNMINTFDEAIAFVKDYTNEQIIRLIYSQPRFTGIIMDGLIDIYYKNKKTDIKVVDNNEQQENDQLRASRNLAIIDEVLFETRKQGTKGNVGFPQKEYNDDQMEIILTNLVKGNNNYITDKALKTKISNISKEEIFAEVLKNALRLNCLCDDETDLLEVSYYEIPPTHLATVRILIHELFQEPIDNSNITSLIENIDKDTLTFLNKSFILSRKKEFMRDKISHAADYYQYTSELIESLDKVGNKNLMNEENFSK